MSLRANSSGYRKNVVGIFTGDDNKLSGDSLGDGLEYSSGALEEVTGERGYGKCLRSHCETVLNESGAGKGKVERRNRRSGIAEFERGGVVYRYEEQVLIKVPLFSYFFPFFFLTIFTIFREE